MRNNKTSAVSQYEELILARRGELAQAHQDASTFIQTDIPAMAIMQALIRMSDPANDPLYTESRHRTDHREFLLAASRMPYGALAITHMHPRVGRITSGVYRPPTLSSRWEGNKAVVLHDVERDGLYRIYIDGIIKVSFESFSSI